MGASKIVRMVAVAAALIFAFWTTFDYAGLVLAILGLGVGYFVEAERRTLYLVTVVALSAAAVSGSLDIDTLGVVGDKITAIFGNVSKILNAGALVVIGTGIYEKVME
jgi:hypothetical protein